jgi:hypothetical protein
MVGFRVKRSCRPKARRCGPVPNRAAEKVAGESRARTYPADGLVVRHGILFEKSHESEKAEERVLGDPPSQRCRLKQQNSPARPENSAAIFEKRVSTVCSHLIVSKSGS